METIRRKLVHFGAIFGVVTLLSGCMKVDMDMKLGKDEKMSGTMIVAIQASLLEMMGQTKADFIKEMNQDQSDLPKGATVKTYDKDGFIGQEVKFSGIPASDFSKLSSTATDTASGATGGTPGADDLQLVKKNGKWLLTGTMDLSSAGATPSSKPKPGEPNLSALMAGFKIRIKMNFPGKIVEHDKWGKVKGNSIEWTPKAGEKVVMRAVANMK